MKAIIHPSEINGKLSAPPSKSYTHRTIVCGLLSNGISRIENPLYCDDTEASIHLARLLGARIRRGEALSIKGPEHLNTPPEIMDCRASGTTLRLFTALSALTNGLCQLAGDEALLARPIHHLIDALQQLGVRAKRKSSGMSSIIEVQGKGSIDGGHVALPGHISSQYISGLLFLCATGLNPSIVQISSKLESRSYVEMTAEVMSHFGVTVEPSNDWHSIRIPGPQEYQPSSYRVEGDFSSAAFLLAAGVLAGSITLTGLRQETLQGDIAILQHLKQMGAKVRFVADQVTAHRADLTGITIDVSNTPDLVPILAVLASQASGTTRITNASRLRFKESDRLATTSQELMKLGIDIREMSDGLEVRGPSAIHGGTINPHADHRIAMSCAIAGLISETPVVIQNIECTTKSYPNFMRDLDLIGAKTEIEHNRTEEDIR